MQYQLFNQLRNILMQYQINEKDYTKYVEKTTKIFFDAHIKTLIPINSDKHLLKDYATKDNVYCYKITPEYTTILPDERKVDWEFSDNIFGFYMLKGNIYFIEMKDGILTLEILEPFEKIQTFIYDKLAVKWLLENNLLTINMFLHPEKINSYVKIFAKNYLNPDYYKETKVYKNYNMLPEQISNLNLDRLENHISEISNLEGYKLKL